VELRELLVAAVAGCLAARMFPAAPRRVQPGRQDHQEVPLPRVPAAAAAHKLRDVYEEATLVAPEGLASFVKGLKVPGVYEQQLLWVAHRARTLEDFVDGSKRVLVALAEARQKELLQSQRRAELIRNPGLRDDEAKHWAKFEVLLRKLWWVLEVCRQGGPVAAAEQRPPAAMQRVLAADREQGTQLAVQEATWAATKAAAAGRAEPSVSQKSDVAECPAAAVTASPLTALAGSAKAAVWRRVAGTGGNQDIDAALVHPSRLNFDLDEEVESAYALG